MVPNYLEHSPLPTHAVADGRRTTQAYYGRVTGDKMPNRIILPIYDIGLMAVERFPDINDGDIYKMYEQILYYFMEMNTVDPPNLPRLKHEYLRYCSSNVTMGEISDLEVVFQNVFIKLRSVMIQCGFRDLIAADGGFNYYISGVRNSGNVMILDYFAY